MNKLMFFGAPPIASLIAPDLMAVMHDAATMVSYRDGVTIQSRGDAKVSLSIIREGAVRIGNPGSDGSIVTTAVLGPGHCFGEMTLFANLPRTHDAVAIGETVIAELSASAYERIRIAYPRIDRAMLAMLSQRLHAMLEFADDLRRLSLPTQLAKLLLSMLTIDESDVDISQDMLASILGVTRVSVSSALKRLEQGALIKRGYGRIFIRDRTALSSWVAEHSTLSRLDPEILVHTGSRSRP